MFEEIKDNLQLLKNWGIDWFIAGGWTIDFFIGYKSRSHKDFEISIWRNDQKFIHDSLPDWKIQKVIPKVKTEIWEKDEYLELPIHEIHANKGNKNIEILLNENNGCDWIFRRDNRINIIINDFYFTKGNIKVIAPEIVLLYKAKTLNDNDILDFKNTIQLLSKKSRSWLKNALLIYDPNHKWIMEL